VYDWIRSYEEKLAAIAPLDAAWFGEALAAARRGDRIARVAIAERSLPEVYELSRAFAREKGRDDLEWIVERGHHLSLVAVDTFAGENLSEYRRHIERVLREGWLRS